MSSRRNNGHLENAIYSYGGPRGRDVINDLHSVYYVWSCYVTSLTVDGRARGQCHWCYSWWPIRRPLVSQSPIEGSKWDYTFWHLSSYGLFNIHDVATYQCRTHRYFGCHGGEVQFCKWCSHRPYCVKAGRVSRFWSRFDLSSCRFQLKKPLLLAPGLLEEVHC